MGADAMLSAYNSARDAVKAAKSKRKQAAALRVRRYLMRVRVFDSHTVCLQKLLNPELAARAKLARHDRRVQGKKRKLEDVRRMRDAGMRVKNRRTARQ